MLNNSCMSTAVQTVADRPGFYDNSHVDNGKISFVTSIFFLIWWIFSVIWKRKNICIHHGRVFCLVYVLGISMSLVIFIQFKFYSYFFYCLKLISHVPGFSLMGYCEVCTVLVFCFVYFTKLYNKLYTLFHLYIIIILDNLI